MSTLPCELPPDRRSIRVALCWSFVLLVSLATAIALALLAPRMAPVRPGSTAIFWKVASGVDLAGHGPDTTLGLRMAYVVDSDWVAYEMGHLHGSELFSVPQADAADQFAAVVEQLAMDVQQGEENVYTVGFAKWQALAKPSRDLKSLVASMNQAKRERIAARDIELLASWVAQEQQFLQRWNRARWYWANIAFEWLFFSGLALFAVCPLMRRRSSAYRWAFHEGLLPLLFMSPVYLGYATYSFTSAGPRGGIVYPFLLMFAPRGYCNAADRWILAHLPQLLEPLSTPIGSWIALTGRGMPGPTVVIITSVAVAAVTFSIHVGLNRLAKNPARFRPVATT